MKKLIAGLLSACMLLTPAFAFTFEELDNEEIFSPEIIQKENISEWAKSGVAAAREAGLIPELTGDPGYKDTITREQFAELAVQMVVVANGKKPDASAVRAFADCDNPNVLAAAAAGIVSGVGDGKFAPKQTTNREQIAVMINSAICYLEEQTGKDLTPKEATIDSYTDKDQVSGWAVKGMGTLTANGMMSGTSATTLSPKNSCTVEQSILLLFQVYKAAVA